MNDEKLKELYFHLRSMQKHAKGIWTYENYTNKSAEINGLLKDRGIEI